MSRVANQVQEIQNITVDVNHQRHKLAAILKSLIPKNVFIQQCCLAEGSVLIPQGTAEQSFQGAALLVLR